MLTRALLSDISGGRIKNYDTKPALKRIIIFISAFRWR